MASPGNQPAEPGAYLDASVWDELSSMYRRGCVFCAPHRLLRQGGTAAFPLTFDPFPLTEGHLILHTREHLGCAGEVPPHQWSELLAVKAAARSLLAEAYGAVTLFEHGRAGSCLSEGPEHRLCHHMHLHLVPGDHDVRGALAERFDGVSMDAYEQITDLYELCGNYLYLEDSAGTMSFHPVTGPIERHLMRSLLAVALARPDRADWQRHREPGLLASGLRRLGPVEHPLGSGVRR